MNIKPLADRVLVLPAQAEEKVGGIIIPDTAKEKPQHGTIVAAGNGTKDEEMVLKEGDEVLYGKYSGTELEVEGTKYLIMRQSDVLKLAWICTQIAGSLLQSAFLGDIIQVVHKRTSL